MKHLVLFIFCSLTFGLNAQSDADYLKSIYKNSLTNGQSYQWLDYLSNEIGGRLSGSLNAELAVKYTKTELENLGLDRVWLQPVMVPKWVRGTPEFAYIETAPGKTISVNICALGGSVATPLQGVKAEVIEVQGIEELKALDRKDVEGKIVFFNRPMQADLILTFEAYGGCVDQRYNGAEEAAKLGAVAMIVRSMNLRLDDLPHTGAMSYGNTPVSKRISSSAISTNDAEKLSGMLKIDSSLKLKISGSTPKRTIRVVLFMNEENGLRGGNTYAKEATRKGENHVFALESDSGGFTPRGFTFDGPDYKVDQIMEWKPLFEPYLIHYFKKGGSGADIGPLKKSTNVLAGLRPDSQRYFDHHHAANDTFDAVNKRELELGAATMTSLIYLVDKYGLNSIKKIPQLKD
jgi:hypothetical protein